MAIPLQHYHPPLKVVDTPDKAFQTCFLRVLDHHIGKKVQTQYHFDHCQLKHPLHHLLCQPEAMADRAGAPVLANDPFIYLLGQWQCQWLTCSSNYQNCCSL